MEFTVTTRIEKQTSDSLGNRTLINNNFKGRDVPTISPQGQEMLVDQADSKEWILDATSGPAFNVNLIPLLNTVVGKIKFIHIECYKKIVDVGDINAPIRFSLNWGGTAMGKMSQFQLANADSLTAANITLTNVEVSGTDKAIVQIIFGVKQ